MMRDRPVRYASDAEFRAKTIIDYLGRTSPSKPILVSSTDASIFCRNKPDWFVRDGDADERTPSERVAVGPDACRTTFVRAVVLPSTILSGRQWALYRQAPERLD